ncbi:MAG TPA: holo-ACP synthase [Candidatus Aveggerthella excrementigallinarum]|nr:holo-ACP synthase [Candidatus Aveggerthella excrementigallinarum]
MVKGVGIDTVEIARMRKRCADLSCAFVQRTFTDGERAEAERRHDAASYLAGRFAVKEATYKAIAHLTDAGVLDFRSVETLADERGCPHVVPSDRLRRALDEAGVAELLVSITNEAGRATAIVIAQ